MADKSMNTTLREMYLEYVNDFLTVERFAEYHEISVLDAQALIYLGKRYHKQYVEMHRTTTV